jgi:hypothetical protein
MDPQCRILFQIKQYTECQYANNSFQVYTVLHLCLVLPTAVFGLTICRFLMCVKTEKFLASKFVLSLLTLKTCKTEQNFFWFAYCVLYVHYEWFAHEKNSLVCSFMYRYCKTIQIYENAVFFQFIIEMDLKIGATIDKSTTLSKQVSFNISETQWTSSIFFPEEFVQSQHEKGSHYDDITANRLLLTEKQKLRRFIHSWPWA